MPLTQRNRQTHLTGMIASRSMLDSSGSRWTLAGSVRVYTPAQQQVADRQSRNFVATEIGKFLGSGFGTCNRPNASGQTLCVGTIGTFTVGDTVVTNEPGLSKDKLEHELGHSRDYADDPLFFVGWVYWEVVGVGAYAVNGKPRWCVSDRGCYNPDEIAADPFLGGYWDGRFMPSGPPPRFN